MVIILAGVLIFLSITPLGRGTTLIGSKSLRRAFCANSLYGNGLCQIARLIHIGALGDGDMISKQLHRHGINQWSD